MEGDVGYCPQFDALDGQLTGKEQLYFYAFLKGVPDAQYVSVHYYYSLSFSIKNNV